MFQSIRNGSKRSGWGSPLGPASTNVSRKAGCAGVTGTASQFPAEQNAPNSCASNCAAWDMNRRFEPSFGLRRKFCWLMRLIALELLIAAIIRNLPAAALAGTPVDFNRDVRPILSENCFKCHGPDDTQRKAKLRLDDRAAALKHGTVIVPGKSSESELIERVSATDAADRMPPAKTGKQLTPRQIATLKQWIDEGAKYSAHWSFIPPQRQPLPSVKLGAWPRTPIDRFILARLEREGLQPSPEADRPTLIRRLTLDLTGLPPTLREIDDFLSDPSPGAYESVVDRLLNSPRFGERLALDWLDAARFADTHGYHIASGRDMTRWREWVIQAFNENKPFDQFTVEQIAGDLLPKPSRDQLVASGFNRNHMINFEGGAIPE